MDDEKIIELFFTRSEQAITALDEKYGKLFFQIASNILPDPMDAEECVNDAYLGTWNTIPPQRPNPLSAFVCKIVRNCSISRHRANTAAKRNSTYDLALEELENCFTSGNLVEEAIAHKELTGIIEEFLDAMSQENRVIFMRRYWFSDSYADIADRVGITEKAVSVRLTRIRNQLRIHLARKGVLL